jgi:DNA repair protein RecN (Recombination protein N)
MLIELRIKNYALIEDLELTFSNGLIVLTGETGAGKSIILEAMSLLLGRRAETSMLRDRKQKALVEGVFAVKKGGVLSAALIDMGIESCQEILLQRELSPAGRSRALVNGRLATVERLSELGDLLVDFHGQHKHQSLLKPSCQLDLLDAFGGTIKAREAFRDMWRRRNAVRKRLLDLGGDPRERERRLDILRFQKKEIEAAKVGQGELADLEREFAMLDNVDRLRLLIGEAGQIAQDDSDEAASASGMLGRISSLLEQASELDAGLADTALRADQLSGGVSELASELAGYLESLEFNAGRHRQLRERLDLINGLIRKYGADEIEVLKYLDRISAELEDQAGVEGKSESLKQELAELDEKLAELADKLGERRKAEAIRLQQAVELELAGLGMESASFEVKLWRKNGEDLQLSGEGFSGSETGLERAEFLLSANQGVEAKSLRSIVSGGELSRIMLGLKVVLGRLSDVPAMVFDEVDTGIGGETAWSVGERLGSLAATHQLFAVTHLAQIAAFATNHLVVCKHGKDGKTTISVESRNKKGREKEIARMLGDGSGAGASLEHAREILARAGQVSLKSKKQAVKKGTA